MILGALGVQSFVGTIYTWWAARMVPGWQQGPGYTDFVTLMNQIAAPMVVALVVVMGLCVPKRLFERRALLASRRRCSWPEWASASTPARYRPASESTSRSPRSSRRPSSRSPSQACAVRATSPRVVSPRRAPDLLHLGFIGVAFVIVTLEHSNLMLPVFFVSAACLAGGTALAFYAEKLAWHRVVADEPEPETDEDPSE